MNWSMEHNIKVRVVVDMLKNHSGVKVKQGNPLVLQWVGGHNKSPPDTSDIPDTSLTTNELSVYDKENESLSEVSEVSDRAESLPRKCYYCNYSEYKTRQGYNYHCITKHKGKPGYPGLSDMKALNLTPQGMYWETV
jgi:hypothetical protein